MVEAVEEAIMVVTLLGGETLDYPVFIDTEGAGGNGRAGWTGCRYQNHGVRIFL